jgi:hypothetical protein
VTIFDKHGVVQHLSLYNPLILELGCGSRKKFNNSIGIDILDYECVDIVGDVFEVLRAIPSGVVDKVYASHFLEHIGDLDAIIDEVARVLRIGGRFEVIVPHFSNPYYYSDPTHKTFFGLYTFCYFADTSLFKRKTPTYKREILFRLCDVDLRFKSTPPFYFRHGIKVLLGKFFNSCTYLQELYEENFCYFFPCYEVRYVVAKK